MFYILRYNHYLLIEQILFEQFCKHTLLSNHSEGDVSEKRTVIGCCEPHMESMMTCIFNFRSFHHKTVVGAMKFLSNLTLRALSPLSKDHMSFKHRSVTKRRHYYNILKCVFIKR